jgi:hypothetical protein
MPITLNGDTGIVTPMYNGSITANAVTPSVNMKNRIINGAMVIDQRNAGASSTANAYTVDRFVYFGSQASKITWQQNAGSVTPPAGFTNYLGFTSSSAYTVGASEQFKLYQVIEGFNIADLGWGTANAKTVTLSFWVRSSLTGTFGGSLQNSAFNRCYPFSYTISTANTWEQKSITIAGDTTGTWETTNGAGIYLNFGLGVGSSLSNTAGAWTTSGISATGATSVVGTNGATWFITGCQLEVGSTATSFDYRPYGTELALCQRYYQELGAIYYTYYGAGGTNYLPGIQSLLVSMRASPSFSTSSISYYAGSVTSITPSYYLGSVYANASISGAGFGGYYGTVKAAAEL